MSYLDSRVAFYVWFGFFIGGKEGIEMACKTFKIIAILIVAALIPISAMAGGSTLCDFFGEEEGNFQVTYDLRRVNPGDTIFQNPEGGIKFDLALALYETEAERALLLSSGP